ncbi:MAG: Glycerol-3-phosphate acyltransferase [Lentisphaerae bacterium ADurb.Bin242]|nr:MAG: Glycerol-3-phosphate acyltransferase [Lentisphaerae bacterium ADurb.Bin242]
MTQLETLLIFAATLTGSYLIGSIPFGYLIGKFKGIDIRTQGSGNIGATNVTRVVGKNWGRLCFACDLLKGAIPVLIASCLLKQLPWGSHTTGGLLVVLTAFLVVIGHIYPVYLGFKGGKGVSTAAGAILALNPLAVVCAAAVWGIVFFASRYVSLASLCAAVALPASAWALARFAHISVTRPEMILLLVFALLTIVRHISNIKRLLNGTESRFVKKPEMKNEVDPE